MQAWQAPDVIIVDPARAGLSRAVRSYLLASSARRVVYVSCNPATQVWNCTNIHQHDGSTCEDPVWQPALHAAGTGIKVSAHARHDAGVARSPWYTCPSCPALLCVQARDLSILCGASAEPGDGSSNTITSKNSSRSDGSRQKISRSHQTSVDASRSQQQRFFKLESVQCVDLFPHTDHVETVVVLSRQRSVTR